MNCLRIRPPTTDERAELERWTRAATTARYQRARAILLAADTGASGAALALLLGMHPNTTRRWLHAFQAGGMEASRPRPRGGRGKQFGDTVAEALIALLHEAPEAHGCTSSRWTLHDVAAVLVRERRVTQISSESIRRLLKARHHSWQRAKEWLTSPDPEYIRKKSGALA